MKRLVLIGLGVVGVSVLGFLAYVGSRPSTLHVERSYTIDATAMDIAPLLTDYRAFVTWSPWSELDPEQATEFSDPSSGVGAWYTWSGNDDVGKGRMETLSIDAHRVEQSLHFEEPWESQATVTYVLEEDDAGTTVTWAMDQDANFGTKFAMATMDMDAMLGADFEKGLHALAPLAVRAREVREEAVAAEAEAAAEAAEAGAEGTEGIQMP